MHSQERIDACIVSTQLAYFFYLHTLSGTCLPNGISHHRLAQEGWLFLHQLKKWRKSPTDMPIIHPALDNPSMRLSFKMILYIILKIRTNHHTITFLCLFLFSLLSLPSPFSFRQAFRLSVVPSLWYLTSQNFFPFDCIYLLPYYDLWCRYPWHW